jgi:hypothetical protein
MAILLDKLLVDKLDFSDFRDISANISDEKINIFIRESQLIEIRSFLGAELYLLLEEDYDEILKTFTTPIYNDLWFGADYTTSAGKDVRFNGYANSLIYFSYGRFLLQQQMNVSRFGLESIQDTISEDAPVAQIRTKAKEALSVAIQYQKDTEAFIQSNPDDYPTFKTKDTTGKSTSFNFWKL